MAILRLPRETSAACSRRDGRRSSSVAESDRMEEKPMIELIVVVLILIADAYRAGGSLPGF